MRYLTEIPLKLKTPTGLLDLKPEDTFKPKSEDAIKELLAGGLVKPYCNWLEDVIEDCQYPCVHGKNSKIIKECEHFKIYWNKRLKERKLQC